MSSIYLSALQGAVAGGTAAYLHGRVQQELKSQTTDTWTSVALQVNHVLLLAAETIRFASMPLSGFGTFVQITYALTPLVLALSLGRSRITPFEARCASQFAALYRPAVIAASLATALLGNPVFALTSLSMLAIDVWIHKEENGHAWDQVKKTCAIFALIGYGDQVFASQSFLAHIAKVSTVVMGVKLCVLDVFKSSLPPKNPIPSRAGCQRPQPAPRPVYTTIDEFPLDRPIYVAHQIVTPTPRPIVHHTVIHHHHPAPPTQCRPPSNGTHHPPAQAQPKPVVTSNPPRPSMLCRPSVW